MGPRDLLVADHRRLFGRAGRVEWSPAGDPSAEVSVRAAEMQHVAAFALWRVMTERNDRMADLGARWHLDAEGVRRKLRGETWASLRDLAAWEMYVDRP